MGKPLSDKDGKKAPKGGASVETGLSEHSMFDSNKVRSAGMEKEQARCSEKMEKAGNGFEFKGNSGS